MAKRPVHWHEGMFLKPHHFQAADRFLRERIRETEDWLHPHDWGLKSVEFDEDAIANYSVVLRSCQARFKDGTTLTVPDEVAVDPLDLRAALAGAPETTVYLAVPAWQAGRANIGPAPAADGPRFFINTLESVDENTGSDEEMIQFRNVQARLLLSNLDTTGYEMLPLARIERSASAQAPPRIDPWYVPPILGLDAWKPLQHEVQSLHQQIGAWIEQEADLLIGRKISFESQVLGDAERILRLSFLNTAFSVMQSIVYTRGLHPLDVYKELCRLYGQLTILGANRRPGDVPGYDHEDIGPIYAEVIEQIRLLLGKPGMVPFEKSYFQLDRARKSFQAPLKDDWTLDTAKLYIGVETTELTDSECDRLMQDTDWKLGSGEKVQEIFKNGQKGLEMKPLNRIPPALPAGVVYFEIKRDPEYWNDVVRTGTLGLRFKGERTKFITEQMLALISPETKRSYNLQFAVFVVKPR
jgi:type VI secretion system protein ImpJ